MNSLNLYDLAEKEKIDVVNCKWRDTPGRIFEIDKNFYIALDSSKIETTSMEKQILAEELGHYYCDALYPVFSDTLQKSRCEYRAKKWSYIALLPPQRVKQAIKLGYDTLWELADYFEVEYEFMQNCIDFYKSTNLLD